MLERGPLQDLAALFKVLSDPMRVQLINLLAEDELCVCDMAELLGAGQSAVSNHLRVLRAAKLVQTRREGKLIHYSLDSQCLAKLLAVGVAHVTPKERIHP
jgi:DNA-binding transcriptional ArsR family regulator